MKYKKGDWLITTTKVSQIFNKPKAGEVFKVHEDCKDTDGVVFYNYGNSVTVDRVRLCENHEIPEEFRNQIVEDFPFC